MMKHRGRVVTKGIQHTNVCAEYDDPIIMRNKAGTAWVVQWVYNNGGVPEYRVKSGVTEAAATPASATDGVVLGTGGVQ